MGWFSTTKPDVAAVSREDRKQCWESRDLYFTCLDRAHVLEAGKEGNACTTEKSRYEATQCAKSWIEYFNKRRILDEQQKDILAQSAKR